MLPKTPAEFLDEYLFGATRLQNAHYAAAAYYQKLNKYFGIPSAICGSVTTTSMAAWVGEVSLPQWCKITATACGAISAVGAALMSTLNYSSAATQHQAAAIAWGALRGEIGRLRVKELSSPSADINKDLEQIGEKWDAINRAAPVLTAGFFKKSKVPSTVPSGTTTK